MAPSVLADRCCARLLVASAAEEQILLQYAGIGRAYSRKLCAYADAAGPTRQQSVFAAISMSRINRPSPLGQGRGARGAVEGEAVADAELGQEDPGLRRHL